jgi:hypothetical protein
MIGAPAALGEGPAAVSGPGGSGGARKVSVAGLGEGLPVDAVAQAVVGVVAGRTLLQEQIKWDNDAINSGGAQGRSGSPAVGSDNLVRVLCAFVL